MRPPGVTSTVPEGLAFLFWMVMVADWGGISFLLSKSTAIRIDRQKPEPSFPTIGGKRRKAQQPGDGPEDTVRERQTQVPPVRGGSSQEFHVCGPLLQGGVKCTPLQAF